MTDWAELQYTIYGAFEYVYSSIYGATWREIIMVEESSTEEEEEILGEYLSDGQFEVNDEY